MQQLFLYIFPAPTSWGTRTARAGSLLTGRQLFQHRLSGGHERRQRVRPFRAESFPLRFSGGVTLCGARETATPAAGAKRKGHLRFSFLFELLPFPYLLARRKSESGDRFEIGERQRIFTTVSFETCSQGQIHYCYTDRKVSAGATQGELPEGQKKVLWRIPVSRNSLARYYGRHLRI